MLSWQMRRRLRLAALGVLAEIGLLPQASAYHLFSARHGRNQWPIARGSAHHNSESAGVTLAALEASKPERRCSRHRRRATSRRERQLAKFSYRPKLASSPQSLNG